MQIEDNYILKQPAKKSDITVVVFSAVDCLPGQFHSVKALQNFDVNKVFVNCENNSWYIEGIPGLGRSWKEAATKLYEIAQKLTETGSGTVLYFGGSMGGTGALLYGLYSKVDAIISTGSEATFFKKGSYSANKFAGSEKIQIDWSKLISGYNGNLLMLYGDLENVDREASLEFTSIDEKFEDAIYNIKNYGHRVPFFIAEKFGIKKFIELFLQEPETIINKIGNLND